MSNRSEKVDRRRQNRIQGSWNSQPCWTNQNVDTVKLRTSEVTVSKPVVTGVLWPKQET